MSLIHEQIKQTLPSHEIKHILYESPNYEQIKQLYAEQKIAQGFDKKKYFSKIDALEYEHIVDFIRKGLDDGHSIVVIVRSVTTREALYKHFNDDISFINTYDFVREQARLFCANKIKLIVLMPNNLEGISLEDKIGNAPRMSIIMPVKSWSQGHIWHYHPMCDYQSYILETSSRVTRFGQKSNSVCYYIYCKNTQEEELYNDILNQANNEEIIRKAIIDFSIKEQFKNTSV